VASRRCCPHPRGERMTKASVDTVCDQLPHPATRVQPALAHRGWVYMSVYRNYIPGTDSESGPADGWCRCDAPPRRRNGRHRGVVAVAREGERAVDGPGPPTRQPTVGGPGRPCLGFSGTAHSRTISPGRRSPDHQPMTLTRRRQIDRPSSVSRPNRTLMATHTPDRPSDRTESDSDYESSARGEPR